MLDNLTKMRPTQQVLTDAPTRPTVKKTTADWFHECVLRGRKEVFCEIVTLTPDMARFLLAANTSNRVVKTNVLETYKQDILAGRWALNGETIKIARDGSMIDGQHRGWGVVETDTSIKTLIMFGIDRDSRMTIDQGAPRSTPDYLSMEGGTDDPVQNATTVASVARCLFIERAGLSVKAGTKDGVTRLAVRAEYWAHRAAIDSAVKFCMVHKANRAVGGCVAVAAALVLARRVSPSADDFFESYLTGADLAKGSPILAARNRLSNLVGGRAGEKMQIIFRAFSAWVEDKPMRVVRLSKKRGGK